jgi:hypothetical protein
MLGVCHACSAGCCGVGVNTICAAVGDRNSCVNQLLGHWIKRAWGCHDRFDVAPGRLQQIQIEREIIPEVVDKVAAPGRPYVGIDSFNAWVAFGIFRRRNGGHALPRLGLHLVLDNTTYGANLYCWGTIAS